jgi:hypothetical protein
VPAEQRGIPLFVALTSRYPKSHMGGAPGGVDSLSRNLFPVFDLNDGGSVFASALSLFPIFNVRIIRPIQFLEPGYAIPTGNRFRLHADLPVVTSRTGASHRLLPPAARSSTLGSSHVSDLPDFLVDSRKMIPIEVSTDFGFPLPDAESAIAMSLSNPGRCTRFHARFR